MQWIYNALDWLDDNVLWGIPMIILILVSGIFLSARSKFLQVRKFGATMKHTVGGTIEQMKKKEKKKDKNSISPFEAFSTAVSGTVGTGNIVGVTTAILSGGPGAVFWMWVSAFFGCFTKFAEITLGLFYRKKDKNGEFLGGPMQYIEHGTKQKWLAILFCIFTIFAAIGMGSVQTNAIQNAWTNPVFEIPSWVTTIIVVAFAGLIIIGGLKRIGKVASLLVPFMIVLFIILALILIFANISAVPAAFASIFASAFTPSSMLGGFMGYGIAQAMRFGFARGIFSNEAGLGSAPIAHATADTKEPVAQGLWGIFEVFIDTFVVCTLTALLVLTSTPNPDTLEAGAEAVAMGAFGDVLGAFGTICFSIMLPLFAFSTILAWALYGTKASQYLFKNHQKGAKLGFNILYLALIVGVGLLTFFFGENLGSDFVWLISDMGNALMAIPNLIALVMLSGLLVKICKNYFDRKAGKDVKPLVSAYDDNGNTLYNFKSKLTDEQAIEATEGATEKSE